MWNGGGGEVLKTPPNLRLRGFGTGSYYPYFCGAGSTLYIFNASGVGPAYEIDLDDEKSDLVLERRSMKPSTATMPSRKFHPISVPTPDGKIILLSSSIFFDCDQVKEYMGEDEIIDHHFGMFDPISKSWNDLPELCLRSPEIGGSVIKMRSGFDDESGEWVKIHAGATRKAGYCVGDTSVPYFFSVGGACFTNNHTLLVHFSSDYYEMNRLFTLDLDSLDKGWQLYQGWIQGMQRPITVGDERFIVVDDCLLLTSDSCYLRTSDHTVFRKLMLPESKICEGLCWANFIELTDYNQEKEQCSFCAVHSGSAPGVEYVADNKFHMAVDVFECHRSRLERCGQATLELLQNLRNSSHYV